MTFSVEQKKALSQPIDKSKVSFRDGNKSGSFQLATLKAGMSSKKLIESLVLMVGQVKLSN